MTPLQILVQKAQDPNYTLGHLFLDCMRQKPPEMLCQIDAATGKSETNASVLSRSIRLAECLRKLGYKAGDVLALGGKNHLDLHIPFYAATLNGLPIVGVDPYYKYDEIKHLFKLTEPKIAFCQNETKELYERAADELGLDVKVVTFDGDGCTFASLMDSCPETNEDDFQPAQFDMEKVFGWLVSTSGTTGLPKVAAFRHQTLVQQIMFFTATSKFPTHTLNLALNMAPVQWISGYFHALGMPIMSLCKLQTSNPDSIEHIIDIINEYRPVVMMSSPSTMALILQHERHCDLTCFRSLTLTGAKVYKELISDVKARLHPECILMEAYGQTETLGPSLAPNIGGPLGSCGTPLPPSIRRIKLVDPETGLEVTEPNVPGELWTKGPSFTEYYRNPEATAEVLNEDGWFKTGDLLCRDENNNYFFVDRIKLLIKYRNYHINPMELEEVISQLPGVLEVCVVGVPHGTDGQRAAAAVARRDAAAVTADDVKRIVAEKLSPSKQLRGGVMFVDSLPKTSSAKIARARVRDLVINGHRE